ncbi:DUF3221 domain-containing protein [Paenibacillus larvae]|uniref:DUF3221 domain-containing protein n=1 Tax=Paenibacillus larvae TaxID=1464 RepID=UPI00227F83F7|nr:DUF3221 domain-containing protein [Paenibacillus larvae]MCY7477809.1 DUF3221 domain-containing protein [Paenibacillus larvae]MDE5168810.1 DUF3221 domain-containing protein [Paenibacillus larvae subsp. larvae]
MITRKKLVAVATTLTLALGLTAGLTPAFAHSDESSLKRTSLSSASKQEQFSFTGYIMTVGDKYMTVADTPTKEEALQGNWRDLVNQGKILIVLVPKNEVYIVGDKVNVYFQAMTKSLPPIAIKPTIEKILD